jgi:hypothetical protein
MGVLIITRIPPKGGKKQEVVAHVYQGSEVNSCEMGVLTIIRISPKGGKKQEMFLFSQFGCFLFSFTV